MEKLCAGVGLSFVLVWSAGWALFLLGLNGTPECFVLTAICAGLGVIVWHDIRRLFLAVRVRQTVLGFAFLLAWTLLVLSIIRNYSGAGWKGDWLEQFNRCLFYLHHFPKDSEMFGGYSVTSRPPGLNIIAAIIMAQVTDRFEIFQLTYTFLNLLLFLPCCLMMPVFGRARRGSIVVLAGLFACSPLLMVNATYTASKAFAAFYVVLGAAFYLAGWRKHDRIRMAAAFLALATGLLVHYSAGPYCVFFALHYLVAVSPKRPGRWKELASIAVASGALLLAWFGWAAATYGVGSAFMAAVNTSVAYGTKDEHGYLLKSVANLFDSIVPHVLRDPALMHTFDQPSALGYIRDNSFAVYQSTMIFSMGIFGGPLAVWFLFRALGSSSGPRRNFWLALIAFSATIGVLVVGERDYFGVGHLTMIAMFAMGLSLLATRFGASRKVAMLIVAGCFIDFSVGVFLQARIEHRENTRENTVFSGLTLSDAGIDIATPRADSLSATAWGNWYRKHQYGFAVKWLRDMNAFRPQDRSLDPTKAAIRPTLEQGIQDDERFWHGWYRNHAGELVFFGDHFGDGNATSALLVLAAMILLWKMAQQAPRVTVAPAAKPKSSRRRRIR